MKLVLPIVLIVPALLVSACASTVVPAAQSAGTESSAEPEAPAPTEAPAPAAFPTLSDEQGAVVVEVTPLTLGEGTDEIRFEVALNTHSVDLSMDLAALASLSTDTGASVPASLWDAPRGGHHVSGTLLFPSTADGVGLLDGAQTVTLTIIELDAATRTFAWELN